MKIKTAKILSVVNRKGIVFNVGDSAKFMGKKFKISAFRTDSPMPNWISTENKANPTYWIMARIGKRHWVNIDMIEKV